MPDDEAAVAAARRRSGCSPAGRYRGRRPTSGCCGTSLPADRVRSYDVRPVVDDAARRGSVLELRRGRSAAASSPRSARLDGRPVGVLANDPRHLGGAIDAESADKAAAFLRLCETHRLPVVSLVDTPGFMVGPGPGSIETRCYRLRYRDDPRKTRSAFPQELSY